jgi:hypothetical protein
MSELVPRLSSNGITYHFEYDGKLYYHSGIKVQILKYNEVQIINALNGVMTVLDSIINKRLSATIQNTNRE